MRERDVRNDDVDDDDYDDDSNINNVIPLYSVGSERKSTESRSRAIRYAYYIHLVSKVHEYLESCPRVFLVSLSFLEISRAAFKQDLYPLDVY
jgi:hypothetical protein